MWESNELYPIGISFPKCFIMKLLQPMVCFITNNSLKIKFYILMSKNAKLIMFWFDVHSLTKLS